MIELRSLTGTQLRTLGPGEAPAFQLGFSPDGRMLAAAYATDRAACLQGKLIIYDTSTGRRSAVGDGFGSVLGFAFSRSGRFLAMGGGNDRAWLWDLARNCMTMSCLAISGLCFVSRFSR